MPIVAPNTPAANRDREGAKAVFAAKQAEGAAPVPAAAPGSKKVLIAIAVGATLVAAAGGGYVWYEINKMPANFARGPLVAPPRRTRVAFRFAS